MEAKHFIIPILPIKNAVFFPKTLLPLYLSDPSAIQMVHDSLNSAKLAGIFYCRDAPNFDEVQTRRRFSHLTLGKIIDSEIDKEGNYSIIMEGVHRVKYLNSIQTTPYILANVQACVDKVSTGSQLQVERLYLDLINRLEQMKHALPDMFEHHINRIRNISTGNPGLFADLIAYYFVVNNYDKQCILSELDVVRRLQLVTIQVNTITRRFKSKKLKTNKNKNI